MTDGISLCGSGRMVQLPILVSDGTGTHSFLSFKELHMLNKTLRTIPIWALVLGLSVLATPAISAVSDQADSTGPDPVMKFGGAQRAVPHWRKNKGRHGGAEFWMITRPSETGLPKAEMANAGGIEIKDQIFDGTYIWFKIKLQGPYNATLESLKRFPEFVALDPVQEADKIDGQLVATREKEKRQKWARSGTFEKDPTQEKHWMEARYTTPKSIEQAKSWCQLKGYDSCKYNVNGGGIRFMATLSALGELATDSDVENVWKYEQPIPLNDVSRQLTGVNRIQAWQLDLTPLPVGISSVSSSWNANKKYTGEGVWIGIYEYSIDINHPDFQENGVPRYVRNNPNGTPWYFPEDVMENRLHGTHVAGIAAGNGRNSDKFGGNPFQWRGIAPKAAIGISDPWIRGLSENAFDVNNHSHTRNEEGYYLPSMHFPDSELSVHSSVLRLGFATNNITVYAAGNNGIDQEHGNQQGYFSMSASPVNSIKVGAVTKIAGRKCGFSSMGPTRDGRIGPDVMAPGCGDGDIPLTVEIDRIQLLTGAATKIFNGTVYQWDFLNGLDGWAQGGGATDFTSVNGVASFHGGYSQITRDFSSSVTVDPADHIKIRMRVRANPIRAGLPLPNSVELRFYQIFTGPGSTMFGGSGAPVSHYGGEDEPFISGKFHLNLPDFEEIDLPVGAIFKNTNKKGHGWAGLVFQASGRYDHVISDMPSAPFGYREDAGTSMAAPHVTGLIALMLQKYADTYLKAEGKNIHDNPFWNSTARAILIHTATDMVQTADELAGIGAAVNPDFAHNDPSGPKTEVYGVGPDWATGYGLVNAEKAIAYVDRSKFLEQSISLSKSSYVGGYVMIPHSKAYSVTIPPNTPKFRVTLVWDDPTQAVANDEKTSTFPSPLTSKLAMTMKAPGSPVVYYPWSLNPTPLMNVGGAFPSTDGIDPNVTRATVLANPAKRTQPKAGDSFNNVQVIDIDNPVAGTWTVNVLASKMIGSSQDYSLVSDFPLTPK